LIELVQLLNVPVAEFVDDFHVFFRLGVSAWIRSQAHMPSATSTTLPPTDTSMLSLVPFVRKAKLEGRPIS
jgi:hypothetical protein